jgi:hypothetical protein
MPSALAREVCHQTDATVVPRTTQEKRRTGGIGVRAGLGFGALFVIAIFVWQGIAAQGAPDPLQANTTATVASLDIGVLVFSRGTGMHPCPRCCHCQHDRPTLNISQTGNVGRGHRISCHPRHVVHRSQRNEAVE